MRLRTLPLSLAGVSLGIMIACAERPAQAHAPVIVLTLLTTVCLQILSNMSNELGDFLRSTDTDDRLGPKYNLTSGTISVHDFKIMIGVFVALCCLFGTAMIWASFGTLLAWQPALFLLLGAGAIWASMNYSIGRNPYGPRGLGDLFVFIFFGIVSVCGSYYIIAHTFVRWHILLMAATIGFFSVGVINVNNIRDIATDANTRTTIPLKIGLKKAKLYQHLLLYSGWLLTILFDILYTCHISLAFFTLPIFIWHLHGVNKQDGKALDKYLPMLVIATFIFALLAGISIIMDITF